MTSNYKISAKWKALLVHVIPAFIVWTGLGFPTDRAGIAVFSTAILTGIFDFVKGASDEPNKNESNLN